MELTAELNRNTTTQTTTNTFSTGMTQPKPNVPYNIAIKNFWNQYCGCTKNTCCTCCNRAKINNRYQQLNDADNNHSSCCNLSTPQKLFLGCCGVLVLSGTIIVTVLWQMNEI